MISTGEKQNRSIQVDVEKYNKVMENYSVAKILDAALDELLSDETQDVTLVLQLNQIDLAIQECKEIKVHAEITLQGAIERIAYLEEKKVRVKEDFERAKDIMLLSTYYNLFNRICINSDWDIEIVKEKGAEIIGKIMLIDPSFDPAKKMKRYKALMDE